MTASRLAVHAVLLGVAVSLSHAIDVADLDQFTYNLEGSTSPNIQWPPSDWHHVRCDNLDDCPGWPEKFPEAVGWEMTTNFCEWCPADGSGNCDLHHQSPINLERNTALNETETWHECIDLHGMHHYPSSCDFEQLVQFNAFTVERHALQIRQPLEEVEPNTYDVACKMGRAQTRRYGRIDFSRGYPEWWYHSHMDFHVPSEHTQEGKRYDAELQMYHFYSVAESISGEDNEMGTVAVFLEVVDDANATSTKDWYMLNKVICQWRRFEEETRDQCGLPSVESQFDGCTQFNRTSTNVRNRDLRRAKKEPRSKPLTAHDVVFNNLRRAPGNASFVPATIRWEHHDVEEEPELDWEQMLQDVYEQEEAMELAHGRHLIDYESVGPYTTYFPLHACKTEYYFKYSGTQTVPPCYGSYLQGTRKQTNHWRVMKDPIKVSQRQIDEMHRLLKDRIAPIDDPIRPCQPDTAAAPYEGDETKVNTSRPLMETSLVHFQAFCECQDWKSRLPEDQAWCALEQMERYYEQPYNYETDTF